MTAALRRSLQSHPYRSAIIGVLAVVGAAAGWYLGSPLFLKTYANEELPAAVTVVSAPANAPARVAPGALPATTAPVAAPAVAAGPKDVARGELGFVDQLHNGTGAVRLVQVGTSFLVRFDSVSISNAPDIRIYLSKDTGGRYVEANSLYLGALKATNGSFNYEVPSTADVAQYKSVVVWCRNFSTLITWADLH